MYKSLDTTELKFIRMQWIDIPPEAVPENKRELYKNRKMAVDMYIDGYKVDEIYKATGIKAHLSELIKKCCELKDGQYIGYTALVPYLHLNESNGKFIDLLNRYPELKEYILGCYYGDKKYTTEKNMKVTTLHSKFIQKLYDLGVEDHEYPLNTATKAYTSLLNFLKDYDKLNIEKAATRGTKDDLQKITSTGFGTKYTQPPLAPYAAVQVDGHKLDIAYNIEIEREDGTIDKVMALRPWLFVVIDVATRVVLGYSISQEENYNQYDVMDAIQDAIVPRKRMPFSRTKLSYPESGGYVSFEMPQLRYALFDTVMLDNAKSHLAKNTVDRLTERLGISLNFGSVATPESRGIVERFFGSLETRGFHKLPSTTGSNSKSPKRNNPEIQCIKYDITYEDIKELVEVLIAEYNTTAHSGLQNLTPLECMKRKVEISGMIPVIATEALRVRADKLNFIVDTRVVKGGKGGKRAHINYNNAVYRNNILSATNEYIGKKLTLEINPRDISVIDAFDENGKYLGELIAQGEYGTKAHSLKTRKAANKLARQRGYDKQVFSTPLTGYEQELRKRSETSRREATKADITRREMGKEKLSDQKAKAPADIIDMNAHENMNNQKVISDEDRKKLLSMTPDERIAFLFKKQS